LAISISPIFLYIFVHLSLRSDIGTDWRNQRYSQGGVWRTYTRESIEKRIPNRLLVCPTSFSGGGGFTLVANSCHVQAADQI
jgi:hypothetical protein